MAVATTTSERVRLRHHVAPPPEGRRRLRWWGPGLLWAMSAVGSGSVLFTPRIGAAHGYALLWLLLGVATLMWIMIREGGRFAVATGRTMLDGFSDLPGPRNWALWVVLVPQLFAAVVGIAGLSALVGSALADPLPGGLVPWALGLLLLSTALVVVGGYRRVSQVSAVLALALAAVMCVAAVQVFGDGASAASGLVPSVPADLEVDFVLPWIGTILAGSMGILWYSYWTATRGFGGSTGAFAEGEREPEREDEAPADARAEAVGQWISTMSRTALVGVVTGTLIITSFLVLGAELLAPSGDIPAGTDVATELTRLLSDVWGRTGYWLMLGAIVTALGGSVLANQDGWSRSFADIVLLLRRDRTADDVGTGVDASAEDRAPWTVRAVRRIPGRPGLRRGLKILFAGTFGGLLPAVVIVAVRDPVTILSASGIVATVHTPFLVFAMAWANRRLPEAVRPSLAARLALLGAGVFYTLSGLAYAAQRTGLVA